MPGKVRSDGFPRPKPDRTEVPGIFCRTVYAMILLQIISVLIVVSALIAALIIGLDLTRRRQPMRIMNPVWILTGLWAGAAALWAYFSFGRSGPATSDGRSGPRSAPYPIRPQTDCGPKLRETEPSAGPTAASTERERTAYPDGASRTEHLGSLCETASGNAPAGQRPQTAMPAIPVEHARPIRNGQQKSDNSLSHAPMPKTVGPEGASPMEDAIMPGMAGMKGMKMTVEGKRSSWQRTVLSPLHCGAGCTLADLIGECFAWLVPVSLGGSLLAGSWVLDYALALVIGIGFQYAAIREMEPVGVREALGRAAKADALSLTAWQIGMYGWMALVHFAFFADHPLPRTSWTFWFMMQIAMGWGFAFSYPVNAWLIRHGIKKGM